MVLFLLTNIFLYYVLYIIAPIYSNDDTSNIVNYTFRLLDEGEEKINLLENVTKFTMVIGNTGSGKSTLVQWLAACNPDLVSKEVKDGTGEYIIEDGNYRIGSSTASKTLFPELVFDNTSNSAYYDCPGFSSTRSTSEDIASSFFIKKVADHGKFVKLLLVTGYPSVRKGVDRMNFMKLLRHVTQLIKNIDKFEDSIAIAVTKVDNIYVKNSGRLHIVSDEKVINTVADFLQSVIEDLHEMLLDFPNPEVNKDFCLNAIKLVNILLKERNGTFTRIGIFRRPEVPGPLSESEILIEGKETLLKIVLDELRFTSKEEADFRYSISEESMNSISKMINKINENIWNITMEVESKFLTYYRSLADNICNKVNSFLKNKVVVADLIEAKEYNSKLTTGYDIFSTMTVRNGEKTLTDFLQIGIVISNISRTFGQHLTEKYVNKIQAQGKYFSFFQLVSKEKLPTRDFLQVFRNTEINLKHIKDEVLRDITSIMHIINKTRSFEIDHIIMNIKSYYENNGNVNEVEETISKLVEGVSVISMLISAMENSTSVQQISLLISSSTLDSNVPSIKLLINSISHFEMYIEYLSTFIPDIRFYLEIYTFPFIQAKNYLFTETCWYEFLKHLYDRFSKYDIQRSKTLYNVANIEQWGQAGQQQGIHIYKHNFRRFLEAIERYNISHFQIVKEINMNERKFTELADVLNELLVATPSISCNDEGYIYVTAFIVKLSYIVDSAGTIKELCKNKVKIKSLFIYAANAIFIDSDIIATGLELQITIAAPTWHVLGNRIINLDGNSGLNIDPPKASNGTNAGDNGEDGLPGRPGGQGGHLVGISNKIVSGYNLKIFANGGNGGNGQHGGNGVQGEDGLSANMSKRFRSTFEDDDHFWFIIYESYKYIHRYYGKPGEHGGSGGNGGVGGAGGKRGKIVLITNKQDDLPIQIALDGVSGLNGTGGIGGAGGSPGMDYLGCRCHRKLLMFYYKSIDCCDDAQLPATEEYGKTGPNGSDGMSVRGRMEFTMEVGGLNIADSVIGYKEFLYMNFGGRFRTRSLLQQVEILNSNMEIIKMYECSTFLKELEALEKYSFKMKAFSQSTKINMYQSFLDRLETFSSNNNFSRNSEVCKMALSYGKAVLFGKVLNLKQISVANHVYDINAYLDSVYQNIESLKNINDANQTVKFVNRYIEYYKIKWKTKLKEAEYFINGKILRQIDSINSQISIQLEKIMQETSNLQIQTSVPTDKLLQQKWKLRNVLTSGLFFSVFKIIGQVVDCFGSVRPIVDLFIVSAKKGYETCELEHKQFLDDLTIFEGVTLSKISMLRNKISKLQHLKFDNFNNQLQHLNNSLSEFPNNIKVKLSDFVHKYELEIILAQKTLNLNGVQNMDIRFKKELLQIVQNLKLNSKGDHYMKEIETLEKYLVAPLSKMDNQLYSRFYTNPQKSSMIVAASHKIADTITLYSEYEYDIYKIVMPTLQAMADDLGMFNALKSRIKLDIKKWNLQGSLIGIKHKMQLYSKNYKVKSQLSDHGQYIENLEEAITTLINIYDRIQNFVAQKQLTEYIADMSSPKSAMTEILDQEMINATSQLDIKIRSNLILLQYNEAVNAISQHVFPFAHVYLTKEISPLQVKTWANFQKSVEKTLEHIVKLRTQVDDYKSSVLFTDNGLRVGWFSSEFISSEPFFVWRNEDFKDVITSLLIGETIVLKADVLKAPCQKEAIKLRSINLKLRTKNESLNEELQKHLQGYILNATHMGNSYYKFDKRVYVITSESLSIQLSYEKDKNGLPAYRNDVYTKIGTGDINLSPYTMWEFQLIKAANNLNFKDLLEFSSLIDMELEGFGSFVYDSRNTSYEVTSLYYKEVGVVPNEIFFYKYSSPDIKITNVSVSNVEN